MITIKTPAEIEIMAEGGRRLASVLEELKNSVRPGIKTMFLEELSRKLIKAQDAVPAFLGYRPPGGRKPYPRSLCVSVNDVVVHGQPSDYVIKSGDIVKLDLGLKYNGFCLDSAVSVAVGEIGKEAKKLLMITKESLARGIEMARVGKAVGDIGAVIQEHIEKNGFSVVRTLTGHGIGRDLHEDPQVLNFGRRGDGEKLQVGMVLAIEPMTAMGSGATRELKDESFVTTDGSLAAHWEHTVAITKAGPVILTKI